MDKSTKQRAYVMKDFGIEKYTGDPWVAPECCHNCLSGLIFGRPGFNDGKRIASNVIVEVEGRYVRTQSGTVYRLVGPARKEFRKFLKDKGLPYDGKKPLDGCQQYWMNGGFQVGSEGRASINSPEGN